MIVPLLVTVGLLAGCGEGADEAAPVATETGAATTAPAAVRPAASAGVVRVEAPATAPVDALVAGLNDTGFDLLRTQPATADAVLSPASIGHALLMARAAADHATGRAIDAAFGLPPGLSAHEAWNRVETAIARSRSDAVEVAIADRIWPDVRATPDQAWIDLLTAQHGVDVETLDLAGDPDGSRATINDWVAERTHDLIPALLPDGAIHEQTRLVLTDAVYLAARWATPFGKYGPVTAPFTRADGSTVDAGYLVERELTDPRGRGDGFVGAEVPYAGGQLSMLVLVPDEGRFDDVRGRLGQDLLDGVDATFTTGPYELRIPRWDDSSAIDLAPWLASIGAAPGSYPGVAPDAYLDAAVHAADIAVDEYGTVAAAATALAFAESGAPEPELTVAAERPFLYVIRHRPTGLVLFAGQVADPTS